MKCARNETKLFFFKLEFALRNMSETSSYNYCVRTASLWSLIARATASETPASRKEVVRRMKPRRFKAQSRFVGDIVHAPVYGRVSVVNHDTNTVTLETPVYLPHAIIAPVHGTLVHIDANNGVLQNGMFIAERDKEAGLVLHIACKKSGQMIQLVLIVKPHGRTSRIRMPLNSTDTMRAGAVIGYAGGTFETRLLLPITTFLRTQIGANVCARRSTIAAVYRIDCNTK